MIDRRTVLAALAAAPISALAARSAFAETAPIYSENGIALGGTDPVAYFTQGQPVAGSPQHALMWRGATWWPTSTVVKRPLPSSTTSSASRGAAARCPVRPVM